MSSTTRLVMVPLLLFAGISGGVFTLAKLHLARPSETPVAANTPVELGNAGNGRALYAQKCAACHGAAAEGTKIAPRLDGAAISLPQAKAQIDGGGSVMPAGLVAGKQEADVLAYLAKFLKPA